MTAVKRHTTSANRVLVDLIKAGLARMTFGRVDAEDPRRTKLPPSLRQHLFDRLFVGPRG
jgi:hypothetical protein